MRYIKDFTPGMLRIYISEISPVESLKYSEFCYISILPQLLIAFLRYSNVNVKGFIFLDDKGKDEDLAKSIFSNRTFERKDTLHMYRVKTVSHSSLNCTDEFENVTDVCVQKLESLRFMGAEFFPKLCKGKHDCAKYCTKPWLFYILFLWADVWCYIL